MKILISGLSAHSGGAKAYVENILQFFPAESHTLDILSVERPTVPPGSANVRWIPAPKWTRWSISRLIAGRPYFRFCLMRRSHYDVIFFAAGTPDLSVPADAKVVLTFHNANVFSSAHPDFAFGMRLRLKILSLISIRLFKTADGIICLSQHGRSLMDRAAPSRKGKTFVIPHGISSAKGAPLSPDIVSRLPESFVLYVSPFHGQKGHIELLEAWKQCGKGRARPEKLVFVGGADNPHYFRRVRKKVIELHLEDEVVLLGHVPHAQVKAIMQRAKLNVFPSLNENCPITMLEIMGARCPLIASSAPPMPEIGGPELDYFNPPEIEQFAELIARYLDDPACRERSAEAGYRRSLQFTWDSAAKKTWGAVLAAASDATKL
jgi:glycosyltransferase involved in cell wall biosynthesis